MDKTAERNNTTQPKKKMTQLPFVFSFICSLNAPTLHSRQRQTDKQTATARKSLLTLELFVR
jgi:hypothetical protein